MTKEQRKELFRTIKYTLIAASAGLIQVLSYILLYEAFHWSAWTSYLLSLILSVIWNFFLNRKYTFKSSANVPRALLLVFLYYLVFTPLSTWWTKYLTETAAWNNYIVEAGTIMINFVTEFLFQRLVVYGKNVDNRAQKEKEQ